MKYINEYNDYEKNLFNQVNSKPEVVIANLIKDLEIKYDKRYPYSTFFVHKDTGEIWMEDDKIRRNGCLFISDKNIWSKIELKFPYKPLSAIIDLVKNIVEMIFKIKVGEAYISNKTIKKRWEHRITFQNN